MWNKLWASAPAMVLIALVATPTLVAARTLLTIADGPVQVLRGTQRLSAVEGMVLIDEDIVRTTAATRVVRIEWPDGRVLDLGPSSEAMLGSARIAHNAELADATAVFARGWAKLAAGPDGAARIAAPGVVVQAEARSVLLLRATDDGALVAFAESRSATLSPRGAGLAAALSEGQAWARASGAADGGLASRGASLGDVPRALTDALPRRAARFVERESAPSTVEVQSADDLVAWWRAEPALMALMHPRARPTAVLKRATPTRLASRPKPRLPMAGAVVPGLPLPVGGAFDASPVLGASTRVATERVGAATLPTIASLPAAATLLSAPVAIAPRTKRY